MTTAKKQTAAIYTTTVLTPNCPYSITGFREHRAHEGMMGFNATLCRLGAPVASLYDDAMGGMVDVHFKDPAQEEAFDRYCESLPPVECKWGDKTPLKMDSQLWLGTAAEELGKSKDKERQAKSLAKAMLTKTCFLLPGESIDKGWRYISAPFTPEMEARILRDHPLATILNKTAPVTRLATSHAAIAATGVKKGDYIRWSNSKDVIEGVILRISTKTMTVNGIRKGESETKEWRCPVSGKVEKLARPAPGLTFVPLPVNTNAKEGRGVFCPECGTGTWLSEGMFRSHTGLSGKPCSMSNKCLWDHPSYVPPPGSGAALAAAAKKEEE